MSRLFIFVLLIASFLSAQDKYTLNDGTIIRGTVVSGTANETEIQTGFGEIISISHEYPTVQIGDQVWMAENLKATHYRNGDAISTDDYAVYDGDGTHIDTYGYLYNWHAVNDSRGLAPKGWHIPSKEEWDELKEYLSEPGLATQGGKLKEAGTDHWVTSGPRMTNETGFTALPGGSWRQRGFHGMGSRASFWTSTDSPPRPYAWNFFMMEYASLTMFTTPFRNKLSVRCIRNETNNRTFLSAQDEYELNDGTIIRGTVVSGTVNDFKMETESGEILRIKVVNEYKVTLKANGDTFIGKKISENDMIVIFEINSDNGSNTIEVHWSDIAEIAKLDLDGNELWNKSYGHQRHEVGFDIVELEDEESSESEEINSEWIPTDAETDEWNRQLEENLRQFNQQMNPTGKRGRNFDIIVEAVVDVDGNEYQIQQFGNQWWMIENLKTTKYRDGSEIENIIGNIAWADTPNGAYSQYSLNAPVETYGYLYNFLAVDDSRGICPENWHVPTDIEWAMLEMHLGMSQEETGDVGYRGTNEGSQLADNENLWRKPLTAYTSMWANLEEWERAEVNLTVIEDNEVFGTSGFLALPGGYRRGEDLSYTDLGGSGRDMSGRRKGLRYIAAFWTSDTHSSGPAKIRRIVHDNEKIIRLHVQINSGLSVRCIRDE
jgi:uncharacterized protein (TIGR02145 family)